MDEEKDLYLEEYSLQVPALNKLINASYKLLYLKTFFTTGEKEIRAWTIKNGMTAQEYTGKIHSDIDRGFIKA